MSAYDRFTDALLMSGRDLTLVKDDSCMSRCPAHDDGRPSLSIRRIPGSVLLYCMAGCETADIVAALGAKMSDLFDEERGTDYVYPGGRVVTRTPEKKFYQSGDTKDTSLFHSDKLSGAGPFWLVEGEKDVLAVESAGGQAVSTPNGASARLDAYDWEPLRGKIIHVVADRDEPGRKRAKALVAHLQNIAMSVALYEPIEGKDAADHITSGHTLAEMNCLSTPEVLTFSQAMDEWRKWRDSEYIKPIPTPWGSLNAKISGGLQPGRLYVVGARTGAGKSVAGVNMVSHAAEFGHPALVVSVEMPHIEITSRILAAQAMVPYEHITKREWGHLETNARIDRYIADHREIPLYICDKATISIEEVATKARNLRDGKGLSLLFIDYAQLIKATDRTSSRQEQVSHIVRSSKLIAMELNIPVILAAQLNRNADQHGDQQRAPKMTDLRESGELEQSADVILLLHRDEQSDNIYMNIPKNRTGTTATVQLTETFSQARIDSQ